MATATYTRPDGTKVDIRDLTEEMVREDINTNYHNNEAIFQMLWSSVLVIKEMRLLTLRPLKT